jgi:hypothetical protein
MTGYYMAEFSVFAATELLANEMGIECRNRVKEICFN